MKRTWTTPLIAVGGLGSLVVALAVAGCSVPTELDLSVSIENPRLTELHVELEVSGATDMLTVTGVPYDGAYAPSDEVRARVEITTAQGDTEELLLRPSWCTLDDGTEYTCGIFNVGMDDGHWVTELEPYLHEIAGTLHLPMLIEDLTGDTTYLTPRWGTIEIASGDMEPALERAANWPHVRWVEVSVPLWLGDATPKGSAANEWHGSLPSVRAGPVPHDGTLQAAVGDSVSAEYRQPDGSVLRVAQPMP